MFRSAGNETLLAMVRAGIGAAILPRLVLRGAETRLDEALEIHALDPSPAPREMFLLWQAGRTHSPLAARTIRIAVEVANDIAALPPIS